MKKTAVFVLALFSVFGSALAGAQDAAAIVRDSRNRINAETTQARSRMVITARNGSTTERIIDQYGKEGPDGDRTIIVFQSPAVVRNTRFLNMDNSAGGTDQWIFLPSLGKVRRIASSESGGNFMGSDMSYDDIASANRDIDRDTFTILREESYDGVPCYVIQSEPNDSAYQYGKTILWIEKETKAARKSEMCDRRGNPVKTMEFSEFKDIDGYWTPTVMKVSTLSAGTSTTLYTDIIRYNVPIPEGVFTTAYLETGRAR
jgi:outer membrane lipoprotein-sorting protein